ncbi:MAG TPA: hypothetical protein VKI41_18575 [Vicinamibacteria bacterium]|nr:hypothetical protein [Vicinamibacteria bacterium]
MSASEEPPRSGVGRGRGSFLLGSAFFLIYLGWGLAFHIRAPRVFHYTDQVFDADIPTRIMDLARFGGPHRTRLHPLFVLLLNPIGQAVRAGLRGAGLDHSGRLTALLMTALAGALGVVFFRVLLDRMGLDPRLPWLGSIVFGLSSSQLFFGCMPESFVFSGLSLVGLFAVSAGPCRRRGALFLAGIGSFAMAVTNLAAALLARASSLDWARPRPALRRLAIFGLGIVILTAPLSLVQVWIYPGSSPFFMPTTLHRDDLLSFVPPACPSELAARESDVIGHLFFANLVAPKLEVNEPGGLRTEVDFPPIALDAFRAGGLAHGLLWAGILGAGLVLGSRKGLRPVDAVSGLLLWVALHAALHSVWGTSLFLYSCQWTFAVVALGVWSLDRLAAERPAWGRVLVAVLLVLIGIQAVCNTAFLLEILRIFSHDPLNQTISRLLG